MKRSLIALLLLFAAVLPARAQDVRDDDAKAAAIADKAIAYLRSRQDGKTGGWDVPKDGPCYPAISALVLNGMLMQKGIDEKDPTVASGIAFLLKFCQPDGGIYDRILPSYNTSIALSCLARVNTPEAKAAIKPAQDFLRSLQFGEDAGTSGVAAQEVQVVGKDHPYYGGIGYGRSGRPDLSNTAFFLQAMHDSGVPGDDPAFQRALVFLSRVQMIEKGADGKTINPMPYAKGAKQGGFIYSTSESREKLGSGSSETRETYEETLDDGTKVSQLRAYGSMTYAGFKSLIYANLPPGDPRAVAAFDWIRRNYTLIENPGIGTDGMYYYYLTMARALEALRAKAQSPAAAKTIAAITPDGKVAEHNYAHELIDRFAQLQQPDGSFRTLGQRWMEDPVLITAYALLTLQDIRK
jgi:squalene-hopene/tetraprenyl-beta-curcumene cyclase